MRDDLIQGKIIPYLRKNLTKERIGHTLAVALLAERLARKHGLNPKRARLAGLLHDAAKCRTGHDLARYARNHKVRSPDFEETCRLRPKLLHAYVGAHLARRKFGLRDGGIFSAISNHTLGSVKMTAFDKCIFVADLLSYDRKFKRIQRLRNLAMKDLDRAFVEGIRIKLTCTVRDGRWIHPESVRVWNRWVAGE